MTSLIVDTIPQLIIMDIKSVNCIMIWCCSVESHPFTYLWLSPSQDLEKSSSERQLAPSLPDCVPQTGLTPSKQQQPHPGRSPQSPTSPLHQPRFASPARSHVGSPVRSQQDLLQKSMDSLSLRSSPQRLPSPARSEPWLNNSIRSPRSRLNNFTDAEKRLSQSDQEPPTPQLNGSSQYDKDVAVYKREPHSQVSSSTDSGYGHGQLMDSGRSFFSQSKFQSVPSHMMNLLFSITWHLGIFSKLLPTLTLSSVSSWNTIPSCSWHGQHPIPSSPAPS